MQVLMALAYHFTGHDMGLRDEIQADIAEAFNEDLADAVQTFTCDRVVSTNWNLKQTPLKMSLSIMRVVAFCLAHTINMKYKLSEYWPQIKRQLCCRMKLPKSR